MGKDSIDKTQEEIVEEIAKALGHSGYLLEIVLDKMAELEKKMARIEDIERYNILADEFNALRKEAFAKREMLMIHREAIGIRKNMYVDASYQIPPKKKMKKAHETD